MQIQKEAIKQRILEAALSDFYQYGYKGSSLRRIAKAASIAPGNIYSYFKNKDDLFYAVTGPTLELLSSFINTAFKGRDISQIDMNEISDHVVALFLNNTKTFWILMEKSDGSSIEQVKEELTELIAYRLMVELVPVIVKDNEMNPLISKVLARACMEGLCEALKQFNGDEEELRNLVETFINIQFNGFRNQLKETLS